MGELDRRAWRASHDQEWATLIEKTAVGDQEALSRLYDQSSPQVYGLALKILGDRETAEEVTLDVYTQVWKQANRYDPQKGTPGGWLMTMARTRAIDRFRASFLERGRQTPLETAADLASGEAGPEEDTLDDERRRLVRQAMATLSSEQREAISLAYFWGLSQSEIASKLNLPLGTVKTRVRLGMIKLREMLAPHEEGLVS